MILFFAIFWQCTDPWDEHIEGNEGIPGNELLKEIKDNSELSQFYALLQTTGIDKELSNSKIFTVWAPINEALSATNIPEDAMELSTFVWNHISYERISYSGNDFITRHKMASGKYLEINTKNSTIDGVELLGTQDNVATNGVLHMIKASLNVKKNIWDYLKESTYGKKQIDYILSQNKEVFNPDIATKTGVDPTTGAAIYDTLSGMETVNAFLSYVVDIKNEDEKYTFFILTDEAIKAELQRFRKYYQKTTDEKTDSLTMWHIIKDLSVSGAYAYDELDNDIYSIENVNLPINKSAVIDTYDASNGKVYVLNSLTVAATERIKPIIIEGECPYPDTLNIFNQRIFRQVGWNDHVFTRSRPYASGGFDMYYMHDRNPGFVYYIVDEINTVKYQMYWVAVHEELDEEGIPKEEPAYTQSLRQVFWKYNEDEDDYELVNGEYDSGKISPTYISNPIEKDLGILTVDTLKHTESFPTSNQGTFFSDNCIRLQVIGSGKETPISLDYIKMVPIIE